MLDVPAKLAARVRLLSTGHNRKTDSDDAVAVALAAIGGSALTTVAAEDQSTTLRLLTERRDDLVGQRTRTLNRLGRLAAAASSPSPTCLTSRPSIERSASRPAGTPRHDAPSCASCRTSRRHPESCLPPDRRR